MGHVVVLASVTTHNEGFAAQGFVCQKQTTSSRSRSSRSSKWTRLRLDMGCWRRQRRRRRLGLPGQGVRLGSGSNSGCLSTFNLLYLFFIFRLLPPLSLPLLPIASYSQSLCTLMNLLRSISSSSSSRSSCLFYFFLIFAALLCLFTVKGHTHTHKHKDGPQEVRGVGPFCTPVRGISPARLPESSSRLRLSPNRFLKGQNEGKVSPFALPFVAFRCCCCCQSKMTKNEEKELEEAEEGPGLGLGSFSIYLPQSDNQLGYFNQNRFKSCLGISFRY